MNFELDRSFHGNSAASPEYGSERAALLDPKHPQQALFRATDVFLRLTGTVDIKLKFPRNSEP
jgi:hypothetical protein